MRAKSQHRLEVALCLLPALTLWQILTNVLWTTDFATSKLPTLMYVFGGERGREIIIEKMGEHGYGRLCSGKVRVCERKRWYVYERERERE